jgi:hypothetical protein
MSRRLTLDDIADLPTYERERDGFRRHIIDLKRRRRVAVGPLLTLLFENRETIRFQIQEMARVERLESDEQIEGELRAYNPLIPEPGMLVATLFIELTSDDLLREWLPKLVGIEAAIVLRVGQPGSDEPPVEIRCQPEAAHAEQLTREDITSSVHYVEWHLSPEQVQLVATGTVAVACDHPEYQYESVLTPDQVAELMSDLSA